MPGIRKLTLSSGSLIGKVGRIGTRGKERQDRISPPLLGKKCRKESSYELPASLFHPNEQDGRRRKD